MHWGTSLRGCRERAGRYSPTDRCPRPSASVLYLILPTAFALALSLLEGENHLVGGHVVVAMLGFRIRGLPHMTSTQKEAMKLPTTCLVYKQFIDRIEECGVKNSKIFLDVISDISLTNWGAYTLCSERGQKTRIHALADWSRPVPSPGYASTEAYIKVCVSC